MDVLYPAILYHELSDDGIVPDGRDTYQERFQETIQEASGEVHADGGHSGGWGVPGLGQET